MKSLKDTSGLLSLGLQAFHSFSTNRCQVAALDMWDSLQIAQVNIISDFCTESSVHAAYCPKGFTTEQCGNGKR